tara:strand:+ start:1261 stop:1680 length:420 start_codon:yes stop_codon:yes gene_type:complete
MIDLAKTAEPYEIPLYGDRIVLTVKPVTTASFYACQTAADKRLTTLKENLESLSDTQFYDGVEIDLDDEAAMSGINQAFFIKELACRHIIDWRGVVYKGQPAELNEKTIGALISQSELGRRFFEEITARNIALILAKKE